MYAWAEIKRGRKQETTNDDQLAAAFIYLNENPVQSHMAKENKKIKKETVDIVIAASENIEYRNELYDNICFEIIPKWLERIKHACIAFGIIWAEKICEIFMWIGPEQMVFFQAFPVHVPIIIPRTVEMKW